MLTNVFSGFWDTTHGSETVEKMLHSESCLSGIAAWDIVKVVVCFSGPSAQVLITALILVEYLTLGLIV